MFLLCPLAMKFDLRNKISDTTVRKDKKGEQPCHPGRVRSRDAPPSPREELDEVSRCGRDGLVWLHGDKNTFKPSDT